MSSKNIYKVSIIGSGRIASSFDTPNARHILSHAHAVVKHPNFKLVGMSDIDEKKGKREAKKWKTRFFADNTMMLEETRPDVVVIAVPDHLHRDMIFLSLRSIPKLIICEKPVVTEQNQMNSLESEVKKSGIPVIINFSRRFDSVIVGLREMLQKKEYGRIISASGVYTNGVLHNGSHMLDLARFLFGEVVTIKGFATIPDHGQSDPTVSGFATFESCPQFSLLAGDERAYALFELEIITEKKRIRLENFCQELVMQDIVSDPLFNGFKALGKRKVVKTKLINALPELYAHAFSIIEEKKELRSSIYEGLKTQRACFCLLDSIIN